MQAVIEPYLEQGKRAQLALAVGAGFALIVVLLTIPFILQAAAGSEPASRIGEWAVNGLVFVGGLAGAVYGFFRLQKVQTELALAVEDGGIGRLRLQRELQCQRMWIFLVGAVSCPAALLRQDRLQFPTAALVLGLSLLVLALMEIWRAYGSTERLWRKFGVQGKKEQLQEEVAQAWRQRYTPLLVLAITIPGYIFLHFGGDPAGGWLAFPPARANVFNMVTTGYVFTLVVWGVVNWWQTWRWQRMIAESVHGQSGQA